MRIGDKLWRWLESCIDEKALKSVLSNINYLELEIGELEDHKVCWQVYRELYLEIVSLDDSSLRCTKEHILYLAARNLIDFRREKGVKRASVVIHSFLGVQGTKIGKNVLNRLRDDDRLKRK